ncbi:hypothetical protein ACOSQ3_011617 [Xanthoceras sorbifolium]
MLPGHPNLLELLIILTCLEEQRHPVTQYLLHENYLGGCNKDESRSTKKWPLDALHGGGDVSIHSGKACVGFGCIQRLIAMVGCD